MHGLVNRAIQQFVTDTYGAGVWAEVAAQIGVPGGGFEATVGYDDRLTKSAMRALCTRFGVPPDMLLEDIGTYLVSHPNTQMLRRLLRFGGEDFTEFLHSLDDLPGRIRLAVPELQVPPLDVAETAPGEFSVEIGCGWPGIGHVLAGMVRAMADDYGALAFAEVVCRADQGGTLNVSVPEAAFAEGRDFDLAPRIPA